MKKIKILKHDLRLLKESNDIMSLKLPMFLFKKVKVHNTSLGNNDAFPPEEDYPFDYKVLKNRYYKVTKNIKKLHGLKSLDEDYLVSTLSFLMKKCKELEQPIRNNLIKVCENSIAKLFRIPDETVNLNCEIVDKIETSRGVRITPEESDNRNFDFEDLNDFSNASKAVLKRRLINSLIQGVSYTYSNMQSIYKDEIMELNPELLSLYEQITIINDYLLFVKEENITDKHQMQGGYVEVILGKEGERTDINVQALNFPFMFNETIRGFFELFAAKGLPEDIGKANYILSQADFLVAEPWDLRFGVELWLMIEKGIEDTELFPYFFSLLCQIPTEEFNDALKEVFAKTKSGEYFLKSLQSKAQEYYDMEDIQNVIKQKNSNLSQLNDAYLSSEELDDFVIEEEEDIN